MNSEIESKVLFAFWLAVPESQRQPGTRSELARLLEVEEATLREWERDPDFSHLIAVACAAYARTKLPEVLASWRERAQMDPEARAAWVRVFAGGRPGRGGLSP